MARLEEARPSADLFERIKRKLDEEGVPKRGRWIRLPGFRLTLPPDFRFARSEIALFDDRRLVGKRWEGPPGLRNDEGIKRLTDWQSVGEEGELDNLDHL